MKKFILKQLLPWIRENIKIKVNAVAGTKQCVEVSVYIYGHQVVMYKRCNVKNG